MIIDIKRRGGEKKEIKKKKRVGIFFCPFCLSAIVKFISHIHLLHIPLHFNLTKHPRTLKRLDIAVVTCLL